MRLIMSAQGCARSNDHDLARLRLGLSYRKMSMAHGRFRRFNTMGDTTWAKGKVVKKYKQDGYGLVDIDVWAENQRGEKTVTSEPRSRCSFSCAFSRLSRIWSSLIFSVPFCA